MSTNFLKTSLFSGYILPNPSPNEEVYFSGRSLAGGTIALLHPLRLLILKTLASLLELIANAAIPLAYSTFINQRLVHPAWLPKPFAA